jgi:coenzyme F420-0:L-glutamate ligase/coenzyme F420-1:gamma-L-glutamate ligase
MTDLHLIGLPGLPLIQTGDDLPALIADALARSQIGLLSADVLVVTSKIVSKAEGRWVDLESVTPDAPAYQVAEETGKDPREVALVLSESRRISRMRKGVLIVEHRLGFICANGGIDHSNTRPDGDWRLLLPLDPDASARSIRVALTRRFGVPLAVVISDSHGRPFRMGTVGVAVGSAGLPALWDRRGTEDLFGYKLQHTDIGFADEIAAAAGLVQGQAAEGLPVVLLRGLRYPPDERASAADLIRPEAMDLYR